MKTNVLRFPMLLVCLLLGSSFLACKSAPDTNRDTTKAANANVAKEKIDPVAIEAEITKLEKDWAAAEQRHDADTIRRILADDVVMTYADGNTGTKASELSDIETGAFSADGWDVSDTKVTVISADAAFITGHSSLKNAKYKDPAAKRVVDISGDYRFTDVYARRNGQWQAVASQTTSIQAKN